MNFRDILPLASLVASLGLSPVLAHAQDMDVRHEKLSFEGIDMTRQAGARVVLQRIAAASSRVCAPVESISDLAMWSERRQCMSKSVKDAVAALRSPIVTAMYEGRATPPAYELALNTAAAPVR